MIVSAEWAKVFWPQWISEFWLHAMGWYRDEETNEWKHFNGEYRNLFDEPKESKENS